MKTLTIAVGRRVRILAALTIALGFLLVPARAQAQVWWDADFSQTFATFGPDQAVTITLGIAPPGFCEGILPVTNIYVVKVSTLADGQRITDVSNPQGSPNTVFLASGGLFSDETIAFTSPGGQLGAGTYGVVFKECRDGIFHEGFDVLFYPAFEVVIPANIPALPNAAITALKQQAFDASNNFKRAYANLVLLEVADDLNTTLGCAFAILHPGALVNCVLELAYDRFTDRVKDQAHKTASFAISHYSGIHKDPPDPNFQQVTPLGAVTRIPADSDFPIFSRTIEISNALGSEAAILAALLHSMERYQGAAIAGDPEWALVHARALQSYSAALRHQLATTNAALSALSDTLIATTTDFDGLAAGYAAFYDRMAATGFNPLETQAFLNLGYSDNQIAELRASIITKPPPAGFTTAGVVAGIAAHIVSNAALSSALATLESDLGPVITTLLAEPLVTNTRPIAGAGGPYAGSEGAPLVLNGSASTDPGGAITAYAWDLDGDGEFDDAIGATPTVTFPAAFDGFIGLQTSDADGNTSVAYAPVTISDVNHRPAIDALTPTGALQVLAGASLAFTITATDPDGDPVSVRWLVDGTEAGTGFSFTYSPTSGNLGARVVRAEASDNNVAGGTLAHEWAVAVVLADADGDGWRANVDCDDSNPNINRGHSEIIGNGIDDDCNPLTPDGGTAPSAAFSVPAGVAIVGQAIQLTDTSTDVDSPIVSWLWSFGDGSSAAGQNPTHVYAAAGTYPVTLSVTDPQGLTGHAVGSVKVTTLPTAAFSFAPNPATRVRPVQFTDASQDSEGPVVSWFWDFGDGATSSARNPVHTYDSAGAFTVSLGVIDGDGAAGFATQPVNVLKSPGDPIALRFVIEESNCGYGAVYKFSIGGVQVATLNPTYDCTCGPAPKTVTITDPAVLALVTAPVCQIFQMTSSGGSYIGWARAEIVRPGGTQTIRIVNTNVGDGLDTYSNNVCAGYDGARAFQSAPADLDRDGADDCTDPDIDGDGVQNAADSCELLANPDQQDSDGDGIGDACDDTDGDSLIDLVDNCPTVSNLKQWDFDHDGIGNVCDDDIDGDAVFNGADNCPYLTNADQADANGDGHGDVCDISELRILVARTAYGYPTTLVISVDGAQVGTIPPPAVADYNCSPAPTVLTIADPERLAFLGTVPSCNAFRIAADNSMMMGWAKAELVHRSGGVETVVIHDKTQGAFSNFVCYAMETAQSYQNATPDMDGDGIFDCKDPDLDSDGVLNGADNCPQVANAGQADVDSNGIGDVCQDTDADKVLDINDNCPLASNTNQSDLDGDRAGDVCDTDIDNDGVPNAADNCPVIVNADQANLDGDLLGDVCDPDKDNDAIGNGSDNCPVVSNTDQRNTDGDALGDACDPDIDNDGVMNGSDNCPLVVNAGQTATNPYGIGDACVPTPITVPWLGVATRPHQVYDGGSIVLHGVAVYPSYAPAVITGATWDPGDGSGPQAVSIASPLALELQHTYTGDPGTPYTAVLSVSFLSGFTRTDNFRVIVQPRTLDLEANMAIDRGLWNLHKTITRTSVGAGVPAAYWSGSRDDTAATSSTAQAFLINNHREIGSRTEDPYVDDVTRALRYLEVQLGKVDIGPQPAGDPDTNHNGIGLQYAANPIYVTGQIADAFVATGTPDAVTVGGEPTYVQGRRYLDLVQDMMDMYWFGQADNLWPSSAFGAWRGGWHYSWNSDADNSTAQWGAITGLAGENAWNIPVPAFVKSENLDHWLKFSQNMDAGFYHGSFGYTDVNCIWSQCMSTTPSGIVQMNFDGVRNDPGAITDNELRFQAGVQYIARGMRAGFHLNDFGGANVYSLYAIAKAFRLATGLDAGGAAIAKPVVIINDDPLDPSRAFDWYRSDPPAGGTAPIGVARLLISKQQSDGAWPGIGYWTGPLGTSYPVIILSPTIFELGPAALCSAAPSTVGVGGAVGFNGSASFHNDPFGTIASYSWNFQDGSALVTTAAPVATTSHAFAALGTYEVLLTVTDQNGIAASSSCPVNVIDGNLPPVAHAGGPYDFCVGRPMILNATGSSDPEGGALAYQWDLSSPLNFTGPEGSTAVFDASAALSSVAPGLYQIGLRVTDDHARSNAVFPNVTIHAANDPAFCNNAPPALTVPPDLTAMATSAAGAEVSFTATATDPQDGAITPVCVPASPSTFAIGTTTVACTVTDSGGLTATGSFAVTVVNNAPTISVPADMTTPATTGGGAVVSFTATGGDVEDGTITAVCTPASGSTFAIGSHPVTCTVTDGGGLTASASFNVTVFNTPPTVSVPANITAPATGPTGAVVIYNAAGNDAESGALTPVCVPASGSRFAIGTTPVTCTVTDSTGATASGSFTVTVTNNGPTLTPPADITTAATSATGAAVSFTAAGNDVEDGTIAAVCTPASGSTFAIGSTTVNCTVTDANGASASGSFHVKVSDTAPSFTPPPNQTLTATSPAGAIAAYSTPTATDFKDGTDAVSCLPASGSTFAIGVTTVGCSATNSSNMTTTHAFTITVTPQGNQNHAPVCSAASPSRVQLWPPNHQWVPITITGVTDADHDPIGITITSIWQDEPVNGLGDGDTAPDGAGIGSSTAQVRSERAGPPFVPGNGRVYHIYFTATDGHSGSCTGRVSAGVPHDQSPARRIAVDDGPLYNSVTGAKKP